MLLLLLLLSLLYYEARVCRGALGGPHAAAAAAAAAADEDTCGVWCCCFLPICFKSTSLLLMLQPTSNMEAAAPAAAGAAAAVAGAAAKEGANSSTRNSRNSSKRNSSRPRMAPRMTVHAHQRGTWLGFIGRGVCVVTGWAIGSSFTNPDKDTAYELFPVQKQQVYVHLNKVYTDPADDATVQEKIKDLHRFYQQQQGYLYSRLLRLEDADAPNSSNSSSNSSSSSSKLPRFVTVSSWLTPSDMTMARARAAALGLPQQIGGDPQGEQLYKTVANDAEYSPTA
ncbi:hypothetical protein Emed_006409 [Eimeria media]